MTQQAWLAILVGASIVVAIVLAAPLIPRLRSSGRLSTSHDPAPQSLGTVGTTAGRPRLVSLVPVLRRTRGPRTVEGNFERAFARIDAVDPYLAQRRIGEALAEVGLVSPSSVFDDPPSPDRA